MFKAIVSEVKWNIGVFTNSVKQSVIWLVSLVISMGLVLGVVIASVLVPAYWLNRLGRVNGPVQSQILTVEQNQMMRVGNQKSVNVRDQIRNMANLAEAMKRFVSQVARS